MALANSAYIINDSGKAKVCWKGITYDGEGRLYAMMEVNKYLTNQETLTKSGNFSYIRYDRKFG